MPGLPHRHSPRPDTRAPEYPLFPPLLLRLGDAFAFVGLCPAQCLASRPYVRLDMFRAQRRSADLGARGRRMNSVLPSDSLARGRKCLRDAREL
jgi:hypothetical protein